MVLVCLGKVGGLLIFFFRFVLVIFRFILIFLIFKEVRVFFVFCLSFGEGSENKRFRGLMEGLENRWNGKEKEVF